jgi:hypothetical protein
MRKTCCLVCCSLFLLALSLLGARPAAAEDPFQNIDGLLHRGEWEAARTAALERIQAGREVLYPPYLAGAVARLALAEAGLHREDDAVWHWAVAQNLDRAALSNKALAGYGQAGELLARNPLRTIDEAPSGLTVLRSDHPPAQLQPDRQIEGELPQLSPEVRKLAAPQTLHLQVVVGADGRLRAPVLLSGGAPGMVWETLEGLRSWRFEPARQGDAAVAVFRDLTFHPPAKTHWPDPAILSRKAVKAEELVRKGRWKDADQAAGKAWDQELNDKQPSRERLAAVQALRALAEAGAGDANAAICRWQAAQHLDGRLYDADLTPYGAAGQLLDRNRWGMAPAASWIEGLQKPEAGRRVPLAYPSTREVLQGVVVLAGVVDEAGAFRQPVIIHLASTSRGADHGLASDGSLMDSTGARNLPRLVAISALDSICDWSFKPATVDGKAIAVQAAIPVGFNSLAASKNGIYGSAIGGWGNDGLHVNPNFNPPNGPRATPPPGPTW